MSGQKTASFKSDQQVPYREKVAGLEISYSLNYAGEFTWRVSNEDTFNYMFGNGEEGVAAAENAIRQEILLGFSAMLGSYADRQIACEDLPSYSDEFAAALEERSFARLREQRGVDVTDFVLREVSVCENDAAFVAKMRRAADFAANPEKAAQVLEKAQEMFLGGAAAGAAVPVTWICPSCGRTNNGNFCGGCGTPRP